MESRRAADMSKLRGLRSYRRRCRRRHEDSAAKLAAAIISTAQSQSAEPEAEAGAAEPPDRATRANLTEARVMRSRASGHPQARCCHC
jgi:hypothetical protein